MKLSTVAAVVLLSALSVASPDPSPVQDLMPRATETGLVQEILDDIEHLATCAGCEALLFVLKGLAELGDDAFVDTITAVCDLSGAEDSDVCAGTVALEGPIIAYDLRKMDIPSRTAQIFCTTLTGTCQWPSVKPYSVPFPKPKPGATRPASSGQSPIQVVHFSDIHVDHAYETGASYNCTKPICCRPYTSSDAPGNTSFPAGPYGEVECDAPVSLEESMYNAIQSLVPDRAFNIFTGDVVEHFVWGTTDSEVASDLLDASQKWQGIGPVYPAVGNHDSNPTNSFPPSQLQGDDVENIGWVYGNYSQDWEGGIGSDAAASVEPNSGSYSAMYGDTSLKLISLNTIFWYTLNFWTYSTLESTPDPSGVLAWLVSQLQAAEDAGQRVWIFAHIPPGNNDVYHDSSNYFDQVIQRYEATIAATFYGHTHVDQFELAYTDYTNPSAENANMVSYIAPSLTPTSGHPAFRAYTVDPVTFGVLDFTQYYANMSLPDYQTSGPQWGKLYSAKETYGSQLNPQVTDPSAELTPAFWHDVTTAFESDDALFQTYYSYKSRAYNTSTCTGSCKSEEICGMRAAQSQYNCITPTPGSVSGLKKRDLDSDRDERPVFAHAIGGKPGGDCEGGKIISVFRSLVSKDTGSMKLLVRELKRRIPDNRSHGTNAALAKIEALI